MSCICETCGAVIAVNKANMVMLWDSLWLSIAQKKEILCPECIEGRLCRKISSDDLKYAPTHIRIFDSGKIPVNMLFAEANNLIY